MADIIEEMQESQLRKQVRGFFEAFEIPPGVLLIDWSTPTAEQMEKYAAVSKNWQPLTREQKIEACEHTLKRLREEAAQ